jgi:hypothetical protein
MNKLLLIFLFFMMPFIMADKCDFGYRWCPSQDACIFLFNECQGCIWPNTYCPDSDTCIELGSPCYDKKNHNNFLYKNKIDEL